MTPSAPKRAKAAKPASRPTAPVRAPPAPAPARPRLPPAPAAASSPSWQTATAPAPPGPSAPRAPSRRHIPPATPGADFARSVYEVARKEVLQHIRTKRLLIIGLFFVLVLQVITMVFPLAFDLVDRAPERPEDPSEPVPPSNENMWFFFHLNASIFGGLFAVQLLCIVLTADSVSSEWSNRTIFLLLSKPVSRTAFVVGKYVGSLVSIMPLVAIIYTVQYLLMMAVYAGQPTGEEVAGFFQMLGILSLGAMAMAAVALFFSTLSKSNVTALILSLLCALILFPLVNAIGDIHKEVDEERNRGEVDRDSWKYEWSHYAHPATLLNAAPGQLVPGEIDAGAFSGVIPQVAPEKTGLAIAIGLGYTALLLGLSILRVNLRNFE